MFMTTEKKYTIRPLKWEHKKDDTSETFRAGVPMGSYEVKRHRAEFEESGEWLAWQWSYCFDEYYDEGACECDSAKAGKDLAWSDWLQRIESALKPV